MQPILTIAIPTYNRVEQLQKCINYVLPQIRGKNIELLVSDNASTDATSDIIFKMSKNEGFKYYRNKTNEGADRNFLYCYSRASGKYVMLLSDDDYLLPGAVDSILAALNLNPVMVYLNFSELKKNPKVIGAPVFKDEGNIIFNNRELFFEKINIFITFTSSMILRTDLVKKISNKEEYIGTILLQAYIALDVLKESGIYILNSFNCVAATPNTFLKYDLYYVWGEQYFNLLYNKAISVGISKAVIDRVYHENLDNVIYDFVLAFRIRQDTSSWNKAFMLNHVKMFDDLYKKYYRAMNMPLIYVIFIKALRML